MGRWIDAVQPDLFEIRANAAGFVPLPKRWVVERTHAWNERARRLIMHPTYVPTSPKPGSG